MSAATSLTCKTQFFNFHLKMKASISQHVQSHFKMVSFLAAVLEAFILKMHVSVTDCAMVTAHVSAAQCPHTTCIQG